MEICQEKTTLSRYHWRIARFSWYHWSLKTSLLWCCVTVEAYVCVKINQCWPVKTHHIDHLPCTLRGLSRVTLVFAALSSESPQVAERNKTHRGGLEEICKIITACPLISANEGDLFFRHTSVCLQSTHMLLNMYTTAVIWMWTIQWKHSFCRRSSPQGCILGRRGIERLITFSGVDVRDFSWGSYISSGFLLIQLIMATDA